MSLVIALYTDSKRYALASDSRATGNPSGMNNRVVKGHRMGDWLVGFAGGIVGGQRMIARLKREYQHTSWQSREDVETQIRKAFATVVGDCGPTVPGNYPGIGADMLFVGPLGIAAMAPEGSIHWRPAVEPPYYWAIGCGDGYAMGWLDSARQGGATLTDTEIFDAIRRAADRYPGIGGEVRIERSRESDRENCQAVVLLGLNICDDLAPTDTDDSTPPLL